MENKKYLNEKTIKLFSDCKFTGEDQSIMEKVHASNFHNLEDALQYFSAMDSSVDAIISDNYFDFEHAKIPVSHPINYINQFLS